MASQPPYPYYLEPALVPARVLYGGYTQDAPPAGSPWIEVLADVDGVSITDIDGSTLSTLV
jgi:hypothetical protein